MMGQAVGRRTLRGAIAAAALVGCATVTPDEALAPAAVPGDWAALSGALAGAGAEPVTGDWLAELSDPTVTPLVAEAIAYNNDLAAAGARVRAVLEQARVQRSVLLPQIGFGTDATRVRTSGGGAQVINGQLIQSGGYSNNFSSQFNLSWELDVWGRLTDQTRAAYLSFEAQELDYAAAALSVAGGTASSFYQLTEARLQRELAERDVEAGQSNLRIIERRYERGVSSSLDVRLARASLAQSRAQRIAREQAEREAARQLEVVLGRYPAAEVQAAEALPTLTALVSEDGGLIGLGDPMGLLFRRPDVLAAERRMAAQELDVSAARKALLPSLRLSAFAVEQEQNAFTVDAQGNPVLDKADFLEAFDFDNVFAQLVGGVTQPIFQGGRLKAQIGAERALFEAEVYTYAQTVLGAYREVEDAVAAEAFLSAQLEARRLAFEEAAAAEELTERRYLNGTTNIFDLISAQQRRIANEGQFIAASRARLTNRIDLYLALGAPFEVPLPTDEGAAPTFEGRPAGGPRFTPIADDPDIVSRADEERRP